MLLAVSAFKGKSMIDNIANTSEDLVADPQILPSGIPEKEISTLDGGTILRVENSDGQISSYKIDPPDLNTFQRLRVASNDFFIDNDTLKTGFLDVLQHKASSVMDILPPPPSPLKTAASFVTPLGGLMLATDYLGNVIGQRFFNK